MSFEDKSIQCFDCHTAFVFTVSEQEVFQSKGYTNEPKRCPSCRQARKVRQERSGFTSRVPANGSIRSMFPATCAQCGKATEVPFQPKEGRPVFCRDCYNAIKVNR